MAMLQSNLQLNGIAIATQMIGSTALVKNVEHVQMNMLYQRPPQM